MRKILAILLIGSGVFELLYGIGLTLTAWGADYNIGLTWFHIFFIPLLGIFSIIWGGALFANRKWIYLGSLIISVVLVISVVYFFY